MNATHAVIALSFGVAFIALIRHLARRELLSIRYALGWFFIGFLSFVYPLLLVASRDVSDILGVQPIALYLGVPLIIVGLVCVQLSISVSGLTRQVRDLSEAVALLRESEVTDSESKNEN